MGFDERLRDERDREFGAHRLEHLVVTPDEPRLKALLDDFDAQQKVIEALCHGPAGLLGATSAEGEPLVKDRRMTSYTWREEEVSGLDQDVPFNLQQRLTDEGARFDEAEPRADHAVRDGRLITGQNPWSSASVAQLLVEAVEELGAAR